MTHIHASIRRHDGIRSDMPESLGTFTSRPAAETIVGGNVLDHAEYGYTVESDDAGFYTMAHSCGAKVTFHIWPCSCTTGEREIFERDPIHRFN